MSGSYAEDIIEPGVFFAGCFNDSIQNADKWINFAGAVISLGASIVTGNGSGILSSAGTILGIFNVNLP